MVSGGGHSEDNEGDRWGGVWMMLKDPVSHGFAALHFSLILAQSQKDFFPSKLYFICFPSELMYQKVSSRHSATASLSHILSKHHHMSFHSSSWWWCHGLLADSLSTDIISLEQFSRPWLVQWSWYRLSIQELATLPWYYSAVVLLSASTFTFHGRQQLFHAHERNEQLLLPTPIAVSSRALLVVFTDVSLSVQCYTLVVSSQLCFDFPFANNAQFTVLLPWESSAIV